MSGHNKWSSIKHKKAATDAKRGKIFSKLAREIMVAARAGGADPNGNITLRSVIQKARSVNMPADNIERAVKKGAGDMDGMTLEEITYEGYANGGVAVLVQVLTDNRNRSASEVRHVFTKYNGSLAGQGSVSRLFQRRGRVTVAVPDGLSDDLLLEAVLEAGGDDLTREEQRAEIHVRPSMLDEVVASIEKRGWPIESSDIVMIPETIIPVVDREQAAALLRFMNALDDLDDVQEVHANFDMDDALLEELET